ncbi:pilus assembly protein TadG-related protein [soil metagenome]
MATDVAVWNSQQAQLQSAADAAALSAAHELQLANVSDARIKEVAAAVTAINLKSEDGTARPYTIGVARNRKTSTVAVTLTEPRSFSLMRMAFDVGPMTVSANAQFIGATKICVILLDELPLVGLLLDNAAKLTARDCGVYANSTGLGGITAALLATMKAGLICSAGGYIGLLASVTPRVLVDCPKTKDPLESRPEPSIGACDYDNKTIAGGNVTLSPGTYCRGLSISGSATVTLESGIYTIKDGPLSVQGTASFRGEYAGFHLVGDASVISFGTLTTISLSAPKDGIMAGLLFYESQASPLLRLHLIMSNNARRLLGTFYLPKGTLVIDASQPVADESEYTAIVAHRMILRHGPELVLNSDYAGTDVPVPEGVGPISGRTVLKN